MKEVGIKPGFCCFGITDKCMLRCKMCYKWQDDIFTKKDVVFPGLEHWQQCIDDLAQMVEFPFELDIGGGEALMYEHILEVINYSVKRGFDTSIASNGYLINEEMAKKLADNGLRCISLSLDSLQGKTHDFLRGIDGVYKRVMDAIGYLYKYNPHMNINLCCVLYDINQEEIADLIEWANKDTRIKFISFMAAMQPNNTHFQENWYQGQYSFLWPKNPDKTAQIIEEIIDLHKRGYKIGNPISQLKAFAAYYRDPSKFVKCKQCNLDRCVLISSVGDIFLCYEFKSLGNIKKDRLKDVWYSQKAQQVRDNIAACNKNCHHLLNCFDEFENDFPEEKSGDDKKLR
ncbi:MAG: radical SAM protein [Candidatus Omnitrophota bacterium]